MKSNKKIQPNKGYYFPMFPIIISKDNGIIDGQNRYAYCTSKGLEIQYIRLPFTVDQINTKKCIDELNKIQKQQDEHLEEIFLIHKVDFKTQILHCSSQMKMKKFYQFRDLFESEEEYWVQLRSAFANSKNTRFFQNEIRELFSSSRGNKTALMSDLEIEALSKLPEKIKVYRGMTLEEKESGEFGISWSLDRGIAEMFSITYAHNYHAVDLPKTVLELEINRSDVIAYFFDREEKEILYLHKS